MSWQKLPSYFSNALNISCESVTWILCNCDIWIYIAGVNVYAIFYSLFGQTKKK